METIEEKIQDIPPDLKEQGLDFIEFLLGKRKNRRNKIPKLEWIGGLKEFKEKYTALELQKKALEWRTEPSDVMR